MVMLNCIKTSGEIKWTLLIITHNRPEKIKKLTLLRVKRARFIQVNMHAV